MTAPKGILRFAKTLLLMAVASTPHADVDLPDGTDWKRATEQERLAYITGFSNALSLGYISDEKHLPGNKETFTHRVAAELDDTSIEQGIAIIDAWYKAHPGQLETPVLQVLWEQAGESKPEKSKEPTTKQEQKP